MNEGVVLLFMVIIIAIALLILNRNAQKISSSHKTTTIYVEPLGQITVASKLEDTENRGYKTLLIAYSLICRHCSSDNVYVDLSEDKKYIEISCYSCGYVSRIPLVDVLPK